MAGEWLAILCALAALGVPLLFAWALVGWQERRHQRLQHQAPPPQPPR